MQGQGRCFPPARESRRQGGGEGLREDRLSTCVRGAEGCSREGEGRDTGFFSLGFVKWNLKGNHEPEGGFLITSL